MTSAIQKVDLGVDLPKGVKVTQVGVSFPERKLTEGQLTSLWENGVYGIERAHDHLNSVTNWFYGDLVNYTTAKHEKGRLDKICEDLGISKAKLRECARVSAAYPDHKSRNANLSWSHHRLAAHAPNGARDKILQDAEANDSTVAEVKAATDRAVSAVRPDGKTKKTKKSDIVQITGGRITSVAERVQLPEVVEIGINEIVDNADPITTTNELRYLRDSIREEVKVLQGLEQRVVRVIEGSKKQKKS